MKKRPAALPARPHRFPPENVLRGPAAAQALAGERVLEQYHFADCDLSEAHLSNRRLEDCLFERCNLSLARLDGTALQNVAFADCKLAGVNFGACSDFLFRVHFDRCQLPYALFGGRRLADTRFAECALVEADFTGADLTRAVFDHCDLTRAIFQATNLTEADFTTARGYQLDPEANQLRGARFSPDGLPGLLVKYGVVVG